MIEAAKFIDKPITLKRPHVWGRVAAIARNAFREAVRDRVLYNLVLFVLLLTTGAIFLGELSGGQEAKIIVDLGLSSILLFGVFIAIFVGIGLVHKEIERRTIYAILSKPIGRGEFLLGKYLGLCLTLLVNVFVMGAGVSLALLFSTFSSPSLSALLTFFVFVAGHFSGDLKTFAASLGGTAARWFFTTIYYLVPNLSNYSLITPAAHGYAPGAPALLLALLYAAIYSS